MASSYLAVNLTPQNAADVIKNYVQNSGFSVEYVGGYANISPEGSEAIMLIFEKYFMRNSSRASLSVIVENLSGRTLVYSVGSGGGTGTFFKFDWGAADSFAGLIDKALSNYIIR